MREIRFRLWDKDNNCFYKPTFEAWRGKVECVLLSPGGDLIMNRNGNHTHQSLFPDRFVIQQFTGLKDRNGKEIYEGDVVRFHHHEGWYMESEIVRDWGVAVWDVGAHGFRIKTKDTGATAMKMHRMHLPEVIGNIYETPELLGDEPK